MSWLRHVLKPLVADLRLPDTGWASRSLAASMRSTSLVIVIGWQVVMIITTLLSLGTSGWALTVGYTAVVGYAVLAAHSPRVPVWCVSAAMGVLGGAAYSASGDIGSILVFAACWQINFATCIAGVMLRSRWVVPTVLASALVLCLMVVIVLPEWGLQLPAAIVVTQLAIVVALRLGVAHLLSAAAQADRDERAAERARDLAVITRRVSARIAEQSRVLHDTAINTLGAIANGGISTWDPQQVRMQCHRDLRELSLLRGDGPATQGTDPLLDLFTLPGVAIRRSGISDADIRTVSEALSPELLAGVVHAAREAILNANKHAGAASLHVRVTSRMGDLRIRIEDDGTGFDGRYPLGRGLHKSVFERARDLGFSAALTTSPGAGTTITLRATPDSSDVADERAADDDVDELMVRIQRRASMLWSAGLTAVAIVLAVAGSPRQLFPSAVMIAIMGVACIIFARSMQRTVRRWHAGWYYASAVLVFWLSAASTSFGTDEAVHWQALAATGPLSLFLATHISKRSALFAGIAWVVAIVCVASFGWVLLPSAAGIVVVAGLVASVLMFAWMRFMRELAVLTREAAVSQRSAAHYGRAAAAERAAQGSFRRWVDAGLDSAEEVLRAIAEGRMDPQQQDARLACGAEERYLRQLVMLSPELVHLGGEMMRALKHAKDHGVDLIFRLGSQDAADRATAREVAAVVMRALECATSTQPLSASVFPVRDGLQLTLIGATKWPVESETGFAAVDARTPPHTERMVEQFVFRAAPTDSARPADGATLPQAAARMTRETTT